MTLDHGRILTTHTGSLPRPDDLISIMWAREDGVPVDADALAGRIIAAVGEMVDKQVAAGIDVVNDGEMSKPSYATYVKDRLHGFGGESVQDYFFEDLVDYPRSAEMVSENPGRRKRSAPACTEEIAVKDRQAAVTDMVNLTNAANAAGAFATFTSRPAMAPWLMMEPDSTKNGMASSGGLSVSSRTFSMMVTSMKPCTSPNRT